MTMALHDCPECGKSISTHAEACPHCGYPVRRGVVEKPRRIVEPTPRHSCSQCGAPADRACSRCGKLVCSDHITWFHPIKGAGAVCTQCQKFGCTMQIIAIVVFGAIALIMFVKFSSM
jgi:predicted amidophosphoribosyltransferase